MTVSWKPSSTARTSLLLLVLVAVVALPLAGCSSEQDADDVVVGFVSQVTGPGEAVTSFVIEDANGSSQVFIPAADLTCHGEPLDHLREHLLEREPVRVQFIPSDDGPPTAISIEHVDG